jgi:hypothetical protein
MKRKVERPIRYLRERILHRRTSLGDADLNARVAHWLEHVASTRVHGTTKRVPREHLNRDEAATLQPLPARPRRALVPSAAPPRAVRLTEPVAVPRGRRAPPSARVRRPGRW